MRVIVVVGAFTILLVGCASTPSSAPPTPVAGWRVVPLNSNDRPAMLVNEQTGDTWIYMTGNDQWNKVQRN